MGIGADRIGIYNTLILCCAVLLVSLIFLIFTNQLWAFYVFAVIFGFSYGGEVPQIPLFVVKFGGTKAMAALMGLTLFICNLGGALGPWLAGELFDISSNYQWLSLQLQW
jgi:MFS family permease